MGIPLSISAVAGAGTGNVPWAHLTKPPPTCTAEDKTLSTLNSPDRPLPDDIDDESTAPTS